ncbi:MAG: prepilin-type N-terminal cleavage/methylation domain-containing protein [Myxococcota bacterium]|jgi:prepilin-type N-terminal cleavage/methylation domain-containing protein
MKKQAGFTLMELMIVLLIIGILSASFIAFGGNSLEKGKIKAAKANLHAISAMIESYRSVEGEYPTDYLPTNIAANSINDRSEALYLALFDAEYTGQRPSQEWLINTDGDEASRNTTVLGTRELFELGDEWDNPIVYFDSLHYNDRKVTLVLAGEGFIDEQEVNPHRNERTKSFSKPSSFQLVSAGPDGEFGTDDDIFSF